ncbi:hypothetical protein JCM17092_26220 [Haloplanus litoreus]
MFALHRTLELESERVTLASLDTDDTDGKSDAASGIVVAKMVAEHRGLGKCSRTTARRLTSRIAAVSSGRP